MTLGITDGTTHGSTDGTTHGTTEATGADGTIRSTTGATGDGAVHGTTEATGDHTIHGIHTMWEDGIRTTASTEVPESATADTSRRTAYTYRDTKPRATHVFSQTTDAPHSEEAQVSVPAQAAVPPAAEQPHAAAQPRAAAVDLQ